MLTLTWIGHPVLNGFGDLHGDPGSLRLRLYGAGVDVALGGGALFVWLQQLTQHTDTRDRVEVNVFILLNFYITHEWIIIGDINYVNSVSSGEHFSPNCVKCLLHVKT